MFASSVAGFFSGLGLLEAIGAQNAFVLRQGLPREHVGMVVLICATSEALFVALGVAGALFLISMLPGFQSVMLWGGVAFLLVYGTLHFRAARKGGRRLFPWLPTRSQCGASWRSTLPSHSSIHMAIWIWSRFWGHCRYNMCHINGDSGQGLFWPLSCSLYLLAMVRGCWHRFWHARAPGSCWRS